MRRLCSVAAVTLVAWAGAVQPAAAARIYAGQPSSASELQLVLSLTKSGKRVSKMTFHVDVSCGTDFRTVDYGTTRAVSDMPDSLIFGEHYLVRGKVSRGKLSGSLVGADKVEETVVELMNATLSGRVRKGTARGRLAVDFVHLDVTSGDVIAQCSKNLTWKSLRKPGFIYAGATSQDEPIVVELTANRKRVKHAHVSWFAPCEGGGAWVDGHDEFDLQPFSLSRRGAFSREYRFDFGQGMSAVERFAGRVTRTKATGSFQGDVTISPPSGTDSCTTGKVSWRAATG